MQRHTKVGSGCAAGALLSLGGLLAIPFLVIAADRTPTVTCDIGVVAVDDGTPGILGPPALSVAELRAWWKSTGRSQPPRLAVDIDDLVALYLSEADAEGVRGDYALAQAVLETGYFTNSDTRINNFAGIAHYDHTASGAAFPDPITGVRAHIQLLKKFVAGNDAALYNPDVAPNAGASATTWGGLAGTWATDPVYWDSLSRLHSSMAQHAGTPSGSQQPAAVDPCTEDDVLISGDYALPVPRIWYERHPEWFSKPHHDYPAADIPVPTGTPIYAMHRGTVVSTPTSGRCGSGVIINGDDDAQYIYCHGLPRSHAVSAGDHVRTGQRIMLSASTGNSSGPHLHLGIRVSSSDRCPQSLLVSIAAGIAPDLSLRLPTSGCTH